MEKQAEGRLAGIPSAPQSSRVRVLSPGEQSCHCSCQHHLRVETGTFQPPAALTLLSPFEGSVRICHPLGPVSGYQIHVNTANGIYQEPGISHTEAARYYYFPVLQMRKLKLGEVSFMVKISWLRHGRSWDLNPTPESILSLPLKVTCCFYNFLDSTEMKSWDIWGSKGWRRTWFIKQSQWVKDSQTLSKLLRGSGHVSICKSRKSRLHGTIYSHVLWGHYEKGLAIESVFWASCWEWELGGDDDSFTEHLLYVRKCDITFMWVNSLSPYNDPWGGHSCHSYYTDKLKHKFWSFVLGWGSWIQISAVWP